MSRRDRKLQRRSITKKPSITHSNDNSSDKKEHASKSDAKDGKSIANIYESKYKTLMLIPILMLLASFIIIGTSFVQTGNVMPLGVSITGGTSATIPNPDNIPLSEVTSFLSSKFPDADINARELAAKTVNSVSVEVSGITGSEILLAIEEQFGTRKDVSIEETGSSLGESFFKQSLKALLIAFVIMGLVVFIAFRAVIPSLAVILSAVFDMVVTMAVVNILEIRVSTAGLAAFLMLIGYSVDTDILLTSKVLRGKGSIMSRIYDAMGTGMTMTLTTIGAITVALIFSKSAVLSQIMGILLIGLVVDIISTWLQNAGILRLYVAKKKKVD